MAASRDTRLWRLRRQGDLLPLAGAMLIMAVLLTLLQYSQLARLHHDELQTRAQMIARASAAAVLFGDERDAMDTLRAFEGAPEVHTARLLRPDGSVFAALAPAPRGTGWLASHAGQTVVRVPVVVNGRALAELEVGASREAIWRELAGIMGGALAIMAVAIGLTRFLSRGLRARVRHAEDRTEFLAHHDALTGLVNRPAFAFALERTLAHGTQLRQGAALMCVDVDDFKQVNDTQGHEAGDAALRAVAHRLLAAVRSTDVVARLGGDEFAILLRPPLSEGAARDIAASLTRQPVQVATGHGPLLQVTTSVGVALLPRDAAEPGVAMRCADVALYHAKRTGKDRFAFYAPDMGEAQRERQRLEQDLRKALREGGLSLAYQPIFDGAGLLRSFEGLARWHDAQRGAVSPAHFIPVAEEAGLIGELGLHCLRQLERDRAQWHARGLAVPPVALNLSSHQFRGEDERKAFLGLLDALALQPGDVEFELTETAVFEDMDKPGALVGALQGRGYALALDDFGTGYSSLANLLRMRCRKLKIDRIFVDGIAGSAEARLLVDAVLRMAHAIGMEVVAEGVEHRVDHACLMDFGCDLFQGFGLARPLSPGDAAALMEETARGHRVVCEE